MQTFHLPGKSAARTPLALAVLVGTAVSLADAIGPQPEVEGRGCRPGHGQPLRHDVLEGEAGAARLEGIAAAPVYLRAEVVHHGVFALGGQPCFHVAVLLAEVVVGVALRADAKAEGGVGGFDGVVGRFHQRGDVLPPPCGQIPRAAGGELGRVQRSICRGVKIVVEVDAVHSVVLHQLSHALHHIVCSFRDRRVQVQPLAHGADPLGMYIGKVIFRQCGRHLRRGAEAVGVHPRFQRKAPAVCFGDEDVQRVEAGVLPLYAGAEMAPRKQVAPVKRVPERPHLRDDGVQPDGQTVIHQRRRTDTEGFFGGKVHPGPFQIAHPDGPPFTRGQGGVGLCFVRRRHRRRRGGLSPAQHHHRPGQSGAACPGQERPPPEPAPPGAASFPPLGHASSCIL